MKTMEEVVILIPFKNSIPLRLRNMLYVIKYYNRFIPSAKIVVIEQNTDTDFGEVTPMIYKHIKSILTEDLFCRGFLFNEAYNQVPAKYYILADGDMLPDTNILEYFYTLYPMLKTSYVLPYDIVYSLQEESVKQFINDNGINNGGKLENYVRGEFIMSGGVGIISGANFYKIGGFGLKYVGWGGEDDNFFNKIYVSGHTKTGRLPSPLVHLWHQNQASHSYTHYQVIEKQNNIPDLILINHEED